MIEHLFFELLQIAIGTRQSLSITPSAKQWAELFALSKKQALVAVAFHGMSLLKGRANEVTDCGRSLGIDEMTYLKWLGLTAKVAQRNKVMNEECVKLSSLLKHDGFHSCILKGQSNLVYYPKELRECRTPGDIDVLFRSMEEPDAIDLPIRYCQERASLLEEDAPHVTYHHADLAWEGPTDVEGHYRATFLCSPLRNMRLQHWLEEKMPWGVSDAKIGECVFPVAPVSYNAIYQLLHIYKHLFEEGIGLRQLLDYYFVLRALHIEQGSFADRTQSMAQWAEGMGVAVKSNEEIMHTLSRFGMKKFAGAVMYVIAIVFDSEVKSEELKVKSSPACEDTTMVSMENWQECWPWMICEPNEKEGKFLLNEILQAGNFGQYDERISRSSKSFMGFKVSSSISHAIEKTKHNLRLLTHYPEEVMWEPVFRVYHWIWRRFELWRY